MEPQQGTPQSQPQGEDEDANATSNKKNPRKYLERPELVGRAAKKIKQVESRKYEECQEYMTKYIWNRINGIQDSDDPFKKNATHLPKVDRDGNFSINQQEYFTLQSDAYMKPVDFSVWLAMRVQVVDAADDADEGQQQKSGKAEGGKSEAGKAKAGNAEAGKAKAGNAKAGKAKDGNAEADKAKGGKAKAGNGKDGGGGGPDGDNVLEDRGNAFFLNSILSMLTIRRKELEKKCTRVHEHGRAGWNQMCNMAMHLRDFSNFCTKDFSANKSEQWGRYLQNLQVAEHVQKKKMTIMHLAREHSHYTDHIVKNCIVPALGEMGVKLLKMYRIELSRRVEGAYTEVYGTNANEVGYAFKIFILEALRMLFSRGTMEFSDELKNFKKNEKALFQASEYTAPRCLANEMISILDNCRDESYEKMKSFKEALGMCIIQSGSVPDFPGGLHESLDLVARYRGVLELCRKKLVEVPDHGDPTATALLRLRSEFVSKLMDGCEEDFLDTLYKEMADESNTDESQLDFTNEAARLLDTTKKILYAFNPSPKGQKQVVDEVVRQLSGSTFSLSSLMTGTLVEYFTTSAVEGRIPLLYDMFSDPEKASNLKDNAHMKNKDLMEGGYEYILGYTGDIDISVSDVDDVLQNIVPLVESMQTEMEWTRLLRKRVLEIKKVSTDHRVSQDEKKNAESIAEALKDELKREITTRGMLLSESFLSHEKMREGVGGVEWDSLKEVIESHIREGWQTIISGKECKSQFKLHELMGGSRASRSQGGTRKELSKKTITRIMSDNFCQVGWTKDSIEELVLSLSRDETHPWNRFKDSDVVPLNHAGNFLQQICMEGHKNVPSIRSSEIPELVLSPETQLKHSQATSHVMQCIKNLKFDHNRASVLRILRFTSGKCVEFLNDVTASDCYHDNSEVNCALLSFLIRAHRECNSYVGTGTQSWGGGMGLQDDTEIYRLLWLCENALSEGTFVCSTIMDAAGDVQSRIFSRDRTRGMGNGREATRQPVGKQRLAMNVSRDVILNIGPGNLTNDVKPYLQKLANDVCSNCSPVHLAEVCIAYDRLQKLEMYHATITQMASDTMCILSSVCSCMDFLLDELMCDRIPLHLLKVWKIDRNKTKCEVVEVPLFELDYTNVTFSTNPDFFLEEDKEMCDIGFNARIGYRHRGGNQKVTETYCAKMSSRQKYVAKLMGALKFAASQETEISDHKESFLRSMCQAYGDRSYTHEKNAIQTVVQERLLGPNRMVSALNLKPEAAFMCERYDNCLSVVETANATNASDISDTVWGALMFTVEVAMNDCVFWEWDATVKAIFQNIENDEYIASFESIKGFERKFIHVFEGWVKSNCKALSNWPEMSPVVKFAVHHAILSCVGMVSLERFEEWKNSFSEDDVIRDGEENALGNVSSDLIAEVENALKEIDTALLRDRSEAKDFGDKLLYNALENGWKTVERDSGFKQLKEEALVKLDLDTKIPLESKIQGVLSDLEPEELFIQLLVEVVNSSEHKREDSVRVLTLALMTMKHYSTQARDTIRNNLAKKMIPVVKYFMNGAFTSVLETGRYVDVYSRHEIRRGRVLSETAVRFWKSDLSSNNGMGIILMTLNDGHQLHDLITSYSPDPEEQGKKTKGIPLDRFVTSRFERLFIPKGGCDLIFRVYEQLGCTQRMTGIHLIESRMEALNDVCGEVSDLFKYTESNMEFAVHFDGTMQEMVEMCEETLPKRVTARSQRKNKRDVAMQALQKESEDAQPEHDASETSDQNQPSDDVAILTGRILQMMVSNEDVADHQIENATKISQEICEQIADRRFRIMVVELVGKGVRSWEKCIEMVKCAEDSEMPPSLASAYLHKLCLGHDGHNDVKVNLQTRVRFSEWAARERARLLLVYVALKGYQIIPNADNDPFMQDMASDIPTLLACLRRIAPASNEGGAMDLMTEADLYNVIITKDQRDRIQWKDLVFVKEVQEAAGDAMQVEHDDDDGDNQLVDDAVLSDDDSDFDDGNFDDPNALGSVYMENRLFARHGKLTECWDQFSIDTVETLREAMQLKQLADLKKRLYTGKKHVQHFQNLLKGGGTKPPTSTIQEIQAVWGRNILLVDSSISESVRMQCAENIVGKDVEFVLKYLIDDVFYRKILVFNVAKCKINGLGREVAGSFKLWEDDDHVNLKNYRDGMWLQCVNRCVQNLNTAFIQSANSMVDDYMKWCVRHAGKDALGDFKLFFGTLLRQALNICKESMRGYDGADQMRRCEPVGDNTFDYWMIQTFTSTVTERYSKQTHVFNNFINQILKVVVESKISVQDTAQFRKLQSDTNSEEYENAYKTVMRGYSVTAFTEKLRGVIPSMWKVGMFKAEIEGSLRDELESLGKTQEMDAETLEKKIRKSREKNDSNERATRIAFRELMKANDSDSDPIDDLRTTISYFGIIEDTVSRLKGCVCSEGGSDFIGDLGNAFRVLNGHGSYLDDHDGEIELEDCDILNLTSSYALRYAGGQIRTYKAEALQFNEMMLEKTAALQFTDGHIPTNRANALKLKEKMLEDKAYKSYDKWDHAYTGASGLLGEMTGIIEFAQKNINGFKDDYTTFITAAGESIDRRSNGTELYSEDTVDINGTEVARQDDMGLCKLRFLTQNVPFMQLLQNIVGSQTVLVGMEAEAAENLMKKLSEHLQLVNDYFKQVEIYEDLMNDLQDFESRDGRFSNLASNVEPSDTDAGPSTKRKRVERDKTKIVQMYIKEMEARKLIHQSILSETYADDHRRFDYEPSYDEQKVYVANNVVLKNEKLAKEIFEQDFNPYLQRYPSYDSDAKVRCMLAIIENLKEMEESVKKFRDSL
jgi:hypothetical protein